MAEAALLTLEGLWADAIRRIRIRVQEEVALAMGNPIAIAGHSFEDTPDGRQCSKCRARWIDIAGATKEDIGKTGFACVGAMNASEFAQIVEHREKAWEYGRMG